MAHPAGESELSAGRFDFYRRLMLQLRGSVASDAIVSASASPSELRSQSRFNPPPLSTNLKCWMKNTKTKLA